MHFLIHFKFYFVGLDDIQVFCEKLCMDQGFNQVWKLRKVWTFMFAEVEVNMLFLSSPDQFYTQMCTLESTLLIITQILWMADDCKGKKVSFGKEHVRQIHGNILSYCTYSESRLRKTRLRKFPA
jgi:hypothetical protein